MSRKIAELDSLVLMGYFRKVSQRSEEHYCLGEEIKYFEGTPITTRQLIYL
jgi:hypothetical protein